MKNAFVTGAGRGLGLGFVNILAGKGYKVFGGVKNQDTDHPQISGVEWVECDVASDDSIAKAFEVISAKTETVDILVNNAGINAVSATGGRRELACKLESVDRKALMSMFDVNSIAPLIILSKFLPLLTPSPAFVINISSCRASYQDEFKSSNANYGYRASKTALNMMTACSVIDLPVNIHTFAVHPGSVRTDMNPGGDSDPKEQARKILEITRNWHEDFNGKFLNFDGNPYPL